MAVGFCCVLVLLGGGGVSRSENESRDCFFARAFMSLNAVYRRRRRNDGEGAKKLQL